MSDHRENKGGAAESDAVSDNVWTVVTQKRKGSGAAHALSQSSNSSQGMSFSAKGTNNGGMKEASGITEIRFVRGKGQNADVKISSSHVVRSQVQRTTFGPSDSSPTPTAKISFPFDPISYNLVDEITRNMSNKDRKLFMSEKWFELVINQESIEARLTKFPNPNIFDQLAKLGKFFDDEVQHVVIHLIAPDKTSTINNIDKYTHTPQSKLKSREYDESSVARAYPFLAKLVDKIRDFTVLKNLDIVVELDTPLDPGKLTPKAFDCVLPFYELDTFTNWKLKWSAPGVFPPRMVGDNLIEMLTRRSEKYRKKDDDAYDNMVVVHESEEKDLDAEELKKWGNILVRR
jgi:hypothetical protein